MSVLRGQGVGPPTVKVSFRPGVRILLLESAKKEELLVTRTIASVAISTSQEQKSNIRTANGIPYRNPVNEWNTVINSGKK